MLDVVIKVTGVTIIEDDGPTTLIEIEINAGALQVIGECNIFDRDLVVDRAHVQGQGLNEVAQRIMEAADVDTLTVHGSTRSTGANAGRRPRPFLAQRRPRS